MDYILYKDRSKSKFTTFFLNFNILVKINVQTVCIQPSFKSIHLDVRADFLPLLMYNY